MTLKTAIAAVLATTVFDPSFLHCCPLPCCRCLSCFGCIITDWYSNPTAPTERFKATVYILDTNLRADGLKVSIFKQNQTVGGWQDANVDADTARQIENSILTRARQLYIATEDAR